MQGENASDFWHKEDWKEGRVKISVRPPSIHKDAQNPLDSPIQWSRCWVSLRFWGPLVLSVLGAVSVWAGRS